MKTLHTLVAGINTTAGVGAFSRSINTKLDNASTKLGAIKKDTTRTPAAKATFLRKWREQVSPMLDSDVAQIRREISVSRNEYNAAAPERKELSTHAALLLADSIKRAEPSARLGLVTTDERYRDLLQELPASYFGMTEQRHAALLEHATQFAQSAEQRTIANSIDADELQLQHLEGRHKKLLKEIDGFLQDHEAEEEKHEAASDLYELSQH